MPQEIEVWYILPSLRREFAIQMQKQGLKQKDIAKLLGITGSAVSQYLKSKRAKDIDLGKNVKEEIGKCVESLIKDKTCIVKELQKCCDLVKKEGILCKIHAKEAVVDDKCKACMDMYKK